MDTAVIFHTQSFLVLALLYYGISQRRNRDKHVKIMSSAIAWDLILILQIELNRGAIAKASQMDTNPFILNFHVLIAVSTVILYFINIYLGRKILQGDNSKRKLHKLCAIMTMTFRTSTFITSYLV